MEITRLGIGQARRTLSELVNRVAFGKMRVILESRGRPKAALVNLEDLQRLMQLEAEHAETPEWRLNALEQAKVVREAILREREGALLPESAELVGEIREERARQLSGGRQR